MADDTDTTNEPSSTGSWGAGSTGTDPDTPPAKKAAKRAPAKKATAAKKTATKKTAAKKAAAAPAEDGDAPEPAVIDVDGAAAAAPTKTAAKKAATKRTTTKKAAAKKAGAPSEAPADATEPAAPEDAPGVTVLFQAPEKTTTTRRRTTKKTAAAAPVEEADAPGTAADGAEAGTADGTDAPAARPTRSRSRRGARPAEQAEDEAPTAGPESEEDDASEDTDDNEDNDDNEDGDDTEGGTDGGPRRRRRRGGRRRRKSGGGGGESNGASSDADDEDSAEGDSASDAQGATAEGDGGEGGGTSRRRRRRRRDGEGGEDDSTGGGGSSSRARRPRNAEDEITSVAGSTRLEAKKQRRREGREAGRRRAPIVSEAEFLARRESVERIMVVRQRADLTQIAVVEDKGLVEHYVARESQTSLIGNVYMGRVQNVLPSMEAAFIDIGKGRNAVLYAGEVNWSALGHKDGQQRKIESVLSSGQMILVQVTKDPIGQKGARLTSQISLAGRFLVYVPDGTTSGISRKLPDTERHRLKTLLKEIVPDTAGVIVRTAAEGASEEELTQDVERLKTRWEDIDAKSSARSSNPQLLYGEPDLTLKVVRDLFTEDFVKLVVQGSDVWDTVSAYVADMAPDLQERLEKYDAAEHGGVDLFATYRIDEQIAKAVDRKVFLPSGGSLIIDRTEAMTVVDVNTGKFTGSGGNLEETVTKNNLEAVEEVVRQLRLRDIGGIIVVDFIDMVLESNRDLVMRRLVECLGRDRTRHQVAEVTSLGLIQMTRKRIGTGLVEAFSEPCEHCGGRGLIVHDMPVEPKRGSDDDGRRGGGSGGSGGSGGGGGGGNASGSRRRGGRGRGQDQGAEHEPHHDGGNGGGARTPTPAEFAAMAAQHAHDEAADDDGLEPVQEATSEVQTSTPEVEVAAAVATRTTTRTTGSRSQPPTLVAEPVETSATADDVPAPAAAPAATAAPTVVTTTRSRRGASRAVTSGSAQPVAMVAAEITSTPVVVDAPEPPKVVTRTRGRAASRSTASAPADADQS